MMTYQKSFIVGVIGLAVLGLCGCEDIVHEPTNLSEKKVRVQEERVFEEIPVADMHENAIAALSDHYKRSGAGSLEVSVTYDPHSSSATAMTASSEAARIAGLFRENGVSVSSANIMPVKDQGGLMHALVSYSSYEALAPEDCEVMPGLKDTNIEPEEDYELGCSINTVFAKQIARPKDLTERSADAGNASGRRAVSILEGYSSGAPNEPLDGETASE